MQQTVEILTRKLELLGAEKQGTFCVDCETYHTAASTIGSQGRHREGTGRAPGRAGGALSRPASALGGRWGAARGADPAVSRGCAQRTPDPPPPVFLQLQLVRPHPWEDFFDLHG